MGQMQQKSTILLTSHGGANKAQLPLPIASVIPSARCGQNRRCCYAPPYFGDFTWPVLSKYWLIQSLRFTTSLRRRYNQYCSLQRAPGLARCRCSKLYSTWYVPVPPVPASAIRSLCLRRVAVSQHANLWSLGQAWSVNSLCI